jgi:uncharacterized membrane protein YjjP (DUF1212 family)
MNSQLKWSSKMQLADANLLLKKIAVGVAIAAIPLLVLIGGLTLTRAVLERQAGHQVSVPTQPKSH